MFEQAITSTLKIAKKTLKEEKKNGNTLRAIKVTQEIQNLEMQLKLVQEN